MTTIQTAPNILTTVLITFSGYNDERKRWEIVYTVTRNDLVGGNTFPAIRPKTIVIPLDDMVEFFASFSGFDTFLEVCYARVIEFEGIVEWDGTVIDDITNDPNAAVVKLWVAGDLLAPPNRIEYLGVWYDIVQPHTASATFPPPIAALYSLSAEQPGQGGGGPTFTVWAPQTYALDAYTSHSAKFWQNRRPNNNQQGAPGTDGSGWMEVTEAGLLQGEWYNLGNEGFPLNYIATGTTCRINNTPNNTFGPTVFGWSVTTCP